jgi:hypothetical protein
MTKFVLNKLDTKNKEKKDRKLWLSRSKTKSKFKEGVLNLNKNFMSYGEKRKGGHGKPGQGKSFPQRNNFKKN